MGWTNPPAVAPGVVAQVVLQLEFLVWSAVVVGLIGLGVFAIYKARHWYLGPEAEPEEADDPLEHYRQLMDDGQLDPQEFERIRAQLQTPTEAPEQPPNPPDRPPPDPPETPPPAQSA